MILQALAGYYRRVAEEGETDIPPEGFQKKGIPFVIVLDHDGKFVGIDDTREGDGKRKTARTFTVPKVFEGSRTVNIKAQLLWDKASYVFGVSPTADPSRLGKQREKFRQTILEYFPQLDSCHEVSAVLSFLDRPIVEVKGHALWEEISTTDPNLAFRLKGQQELICQSREVVHMLTGKETSGDRGICLITGQEEVLAKLENPIKGLPGSKKAESHLVAFNESAYWSYGKGKEMRHVNAPISKSASSAYVSALNHLQQKFLKVGDATTVFWAEKKNDIEDVFADIFGEPAKENPEQAIKSIRILYEAPKAGALPLVENLTRFYVLGLAPNAARIAVRFWHAGTVGETACHIRQHFDDCAMTHGPKQPEYLSLFRLLISTAAFGKSENILPNLSGEVMKAILTGTPYPQALLAVAIRRCRAEQSKKDPKTGKLLENVPYPRAALIKAILVRAARFYQHTEKEVGMALDTGNTNIGYRLGRLFATLEKIQEEASPGINATIRDRFYGAASGTPVTAFPHLMKLKNHHLAKLDNRGRAVNLEKIIGEIMDGIIDFPTHLNLQDQGRFAVGYYHQRQAFFTKHETN